jgi:hypothetical protein
MFSIYQCFVVVFGFSIFECPGVRREASGSAERYLHVEYCCNVRTTEHLMENPSVWSSVVRDNHYDQTLLVYFVVVFDFCTFVDVRAIAQYWNGLRIVILSGALKKGLELEEHGLSRSK